LKTKLKGIKSSEATFHFRLYIAGQTSRSVAATDNLKTLCTKYLSNRCRIEIIDLAKNPALAFEYQIVVVPSLIRISPGPIRKIVGDLSDMNRVLIRLDIEPTQTGS
jgi:circadian clock protein KaiB